MKLKLFIIIVVFVVGSNMLLAVRAVTLYRGSDFTFFAVDVNEDGFFDYEILLWDDNTQIKWNWCEGYWSQYLCNFAKPINTSEKYSGINLNYSYESNNLVLENSAIISKYEIFDFNGKSIMKAKLESQIINLSELKNGNYMVLLYSDDSQVYSLNINILK